MSSLNSLKVWLKDLVINRILPMMPEAFLLWLFDVVMLPRAESDIEAISQHFFKQKEAEDILTNESLETIKPFVIAMVGLPQSGKTTVARTMMVNLGFVHIDSNKIRMWLIEAKRDYRNIDAIVLFMMYTHLTQGYSVIIDSDCVSPGKRAFIHAIANRHGEGEVEIVHLQVKCDPLCWRVGIMSDSHFIHRMYADAVRRSNPLYEDDKKIIPHSELEQCVAGEYARQLPSHLKYLGSISGSTIENDGTEEDLRKKALDFCGEFRRIHRKVVPTMY